jgi:porin
MPAVEEAGPRLAASPSALPGVVKIGAWYNAGSFPLQDFTQSGTLPPQRPGDAAVYGLFEQTLWRLPGSPNRALGFFARGAVAPSNRSEFDRYVDTGFTFRGPLARRPEDIFGIAFAYGRISPDAAANDRALAALTGTPMPIRDYEAAIELSYRWEIADRFFCPTGPAIHFPSRRQYRQSGQSGERLSYSERAGAGAADRTAVLIWGA